MDTAADKLLAMISKAGLIRPRDLAPQGIARVVLTRAVRQGQLQRLGTAWPAVSIYLGTCSAGRSGPACAQGRHLPAVGTAFSWADHPGTVWGVACHR